jgi:F0F1-type ATP synthase gamma subunit
MNSRMNSHQICIASTQSFCGQLQSQLLQKASNIMQEESFVSSLACCHQSQTMTDKFQSFSTNKLQSKPPSLKTTFNVHAWVIHFAPIQNHKSFHLHFHYP